MTQRSFTDLEYAVKARQTRRERFLDEIDRLVPWAALIQALSPHYPKGQGPGRPPLGLERMLRVYLAQQCLGLSDEGIEDAVYDSGAVRRFVGIDLGVETAPDATSLVRFRHWLNQHRHTETIFATLNAQLQAKSLVLRQGTIVDATLIAAPSSTKNATGTRDREMRQTKKGKNWHFGMKAHIGVDAHSGLVHTLVTTSANVHDVTQVAKLLHGQEAAIHGDAGYQGAAQREENRANRAQWYIAMRPGKRRALPRHTAWGALTEQIEHAKARIRAKVEHPFHIVKNLFKHRKTRYRGLAKNMAQLYTLFGLANLLLARRHLHP